MDSATEKSQPAHVWITDGSLPVFSDTQRLRVSHRNLWVLPTRYEGFVDPAVARGEATITGERTDDALFVEAEWYVEFPEGIDAYLARPDRMTDNTPIILQGLIEGKWFNRLLGTEAWRPASLGNNLIAAGPGISTTVGALERDAAGTIQVSYQYTQGGVARTQSYTTTVTDLRGHNIARLLRAVLETCRETGQPLDGIDLGAVGPAAATVNEKPRLLASILSDGCLRLPNPRYLIAPHRAKERLVHRALAQGCGVPPGTIVTIVTRDGEGTIVGRGELTWHRAPAGAAPRTTPDEYR